MTFDRLKSSLSLAHSLIVENLICLRNVYDDLKNNREFLKFLHPHEMLCKLVK